MGNNTRRSTIDKISKSYPELNTNWLLTGEGGMLLDSIDSVPQKSFTNGVPYYNVDFIGGFDIVLNDQTAKPEYLIDFKKYNEATCWCNVTGHSMEPEITHGDIIALKKIEDKSFLPLGEVYAIVTTNGMRTIKRLGPSSDPKCYTLVPTNKSPEYGIQELPKDMIEHIFQVLGCMKRL
ncbi:S24 family peptidase [Phocaeicola coprocola]